MISTVAGTTLADFMSASILNNLSSGTSTLPIFDLVALNAKLLASALVFDMQLKMVVLPILVRPMIPQFNAIMLGYFIC
jgi:hypothetical protein